MADGIATDLEDILNSFEDSTSGYPNISNDHLLHNLSSNRQQYDGLQSSYGEPLTTGFSDYQLGPDKPIIGIKADGNIRDSTPQDDASNSLGTMFLSSVENMLETQSTPSFQFQPVKQQPPSIPKPKQQMRKEATASMQKLPPQSSYVQQPSPVDQAARQQAFYNQNVANNMNTSMPMRQVDVGASPQPFVTPLGSQDDGVSGFIRPSAQHKPPTPGQPPRPLSSSYMSTAQPSPANSNYSGDPPTPLSHHPGTPQSNRSVTPHSNQPMQPATMQDVGMTQQPIFPNELSNHSFHDQNMELSNSSSITSNTAGRWNAGGGMQTLSNYEGRNLSSHSTSGYSSAYQSDSSIPSNGSNITSNIDVQNKMTVDSLYGNPMTSTTSLSHDINFQSNQLQRLSTVSPSGIPQQGGQAQYGTKDSVQDMQLGMKGHNTINMINRASNVAKSVFSNQYEAISPDSNYAPSPSNKRMDSQMDTNQLTPKQKQDDDPVLVYVKDSSNSGNSQNNILNYQQNQQVCVSGGNTPAISNNNFATQPTNAKPWNSTKSQKLSSDNALLYKENDLEPKGLGFNTRENYAPNITNTSAPVTKPATEKPKRTRNTSKNKSKKKDNFEEDFGFGSSEPTIKLGGGAGGSTAGPLQAAQPLQTTQPQQDIIPQTVPSTHAFNTAFSTMGMDSEMQNSMNEIACLHQQQKEMIEKLRQMQNLKKEKPEQRVTPKKQNLPPPVNKPSVTGNVYNNKPTPAVNKPSKMDESILQSRSNNAVKTQEQSNRQKAATIKYGAPQSSPQSISSAHQQAFMTHLNSSRQMQNAPISTSITTPSRNRHTVASSNVKTAKSKPVSTPIPTSTTGNYLASLSSAQSVGSTIAKKSTTVPSFSGNLPSSQSLLQTAAISTQPINMPSFPLSQYEKHFAPPPIVPESKPLSKTTVESKPTISLAPMQTVTSQAFEPSIPKSKASIAFPTTSAVSVPQKNIQIEKEQSRSRLPESNSPVISNAAAVGPGHLSWNPAVSMLDGTHPIYLPNYQMPGMPYAALEMQRAAAHGFQGLFQTMGIPPNISLPNANIPVTTGALPQQVPSSANEHNLLYNKPVAKPDPPQKQTSQSVNVLEMNKNIENEAKKLPTYETREVYPTVCTSMQFMPPVMPSSLPPPSIISKMSPNPLISKALNLNRPNEHKSTPKASKENVSLTSVPVVATVPKSSVPIATQSLNNVTPTTTASVPLTSLQKAINKSTVTSVAVTTSISHTTYYGPKKQKLREASYYNNFSKPTVTTTTSVVMSQSLQNNVNSTVSHAPKRDEKIVDKTKNLNINSHNNNVLNARATLNVTPSEPQRVKSAVEEKKSVSGNNKTPEPGRPKVQSTQMFSLFDSLLQEVSKTASKALKTKEPDKDGGMVEMPPQNEEKVNKNFPPIEPTKIFPPTRIEPTKNFTPTRIEATKNFTPTRIEPTTKFSVPHSSSRIEPTVILPTSAKTTSSVSASASQKEKKIKLPVLNIPPKPVEKPKSKVDEIALNLTKAKPTRPPATFPFKRRPFPDPETFQASVINSVIATTTSTPLPNNVLVAKPITKLFDATKIVQVTTASVTKPTVTVAKKPVVTSTVVVTTNISSPIPSTSKIEVDEISKVKAGESDIQTPVSTGIKLKITAFRSVGGKIIHQSSVLNKAAGLVEDSEGTGSDKSYKKKSKKRKKKKQRKRTTSSDYDSVTSGSSYEPSSKSKKTEKVELFTIAVLKNLNKTLEKNIASAAALPPIPKKSKSKSKREHPGSDKDEEKSAKKIKKDQAVTTAKVSTESEKKSAATLRYKPKFAQNTTAESTAKNNMVQIHRPVGKVPSYLATSKSTILNSVPTIQLVTRNTTKLQTALQDSSKITASTPVLKSVTGSKAPIYVKPGVQYILNTSRSTAQILTTVPLPKTSSKAPTIITQVKQPIATVVSPKIKVLIPSASTLPKTITVVSKPTIKAPVTVPVSIIEPPPSSPPVTTPELNTNEPNANFKFADSFQMSFLKLVNTQNTTTYVPSKPPSCLKVENFDRKFHKCLECSDEFMFKSSLAHHLQRRSVIIRIFCTQCKQVLIFMNKCKFMLHAREHASNGTLMQFSNQQMKPIPLAMCKALSKEEYFSSEQQDPNKYILVPQEDVKKCSRSACMLVCTECSYFADTQEDLENHFQDMKPPSSPGRCHTCDMCHLTLPNDCSYFAHMRMHKRVTPHTCPDCGQAFESAGSDFNSHLSVVCFHSCRISCYKCKICSTIFQTSEMFKRHLEDSHVQMFYKCKECPMAFKTQNTIANHQRSAHGKKVESSNLIKTIYKCPLCDTVFTDNNHSQQLIILQKHFDSHLKQKQINITAYKCKICTTICEKKTLLRDHLRLVHDFVSPQSKENGTQGDRDTIADVMTTSDKNHVTMATVTPEKPVKPKTEKPKPIRSKTSAKMVTKELQVPTAVSDVPAASLDVPESVPSPSSETSVDRCQSPKKTTTTRQPLKLRLKEMKTQTSESNSSTGKSSSGKSDYKDVNGKKIFVCAQCDKEFNSSNSRWNHIRLKHQGIKNVFSCVHCEDGTVRFAKRISINKHLKKIHGITTVKKGDFRVIATRVPTMPIKEKAPPLSSPAIIEKITPKTGKTNSPRKKMTGPTATIRRSSIENDDKTFNRRESYESVDEVIVPEDVTEADFNFPDVYVCAKCKYEATDRATFQDHIYQHRDSGEMTDTSLWQCSECGLCFASVASLSKHLFIKHKIRSRRKLEIFNEKTRLKQVESDSGSNLASTSISFSCKVCYKRFEDDGLLHKHMRTHGLAFVKSKHTTST